MDEFELIAHYFSRDRAGEGVIVGVGDDGAVIAPDQGRRLVAVVDTLVADTHFPAGLDATDIGYRAVAVNLSDMAAMGARPRWMTLALTIPEADAAWLEGFAVGLYAAAAEHGVKLVGGDTTSGECLVISVQVLGDVDPDRVLLRSGARSGDTIFVTGTLGDAAAGLEMLERGASESFLVSRFLRPTARVAYGQALAGRAHAAIDISDGLCADLGKLLTASGVGAEIRLEALPLSAALKTAMGSETAQQHALTGGDDYELCFTASLENLPEPGGLAVTAIGTVTAEKGLRCLLNGKPVTVREGGYAHFR